MRTNLHHLLEQMAHQCGGSPALTFRDVTVSYAELWRTTSLAARGLQALGLARDDRVGIYLDKRIETVAAIFGTSAAEGVFVPINHILKAPQVGYILRDCDVRVLVTSQDRLDLLREELNSCNFLEHVVLVDAHDELPADGEGYQVHAWSDLVAERSDSRCAAGVASRRLGHGCDLVHLRKHRKAQGCRAQSPQPDRRRRERQLIPSEHARTT